MEDVEVGAEGVVDVAEDGVTRLAVADVVVEVGADVVAVAVDVTETRKKPRRRRKRQERERSGNAEWSQMEALMWARAERVFLSLQVRALARARQKRRRWITPLRNTRLVWKGLDLTRIAASLYCISNQASGPVYHCIQSVGYTTCGRCWISYL